VSWKHSKTGKDHADIDATIAIDHITLAAAEQNIGSCWICAFDTLSCAQILSLEKGIMPMALLPLGYSDEKADIHRHRIKRKPTSKIFKFL
jgi:nitroreductase